MQTGLWPTHGPQLGAHTEMGPLWAWRDSDALSEMVRQTQAALLGAESVASLNKIYIPDVDLANGGQRNRAICLCSPAPGPALPRPQKQSLGNQDCA